MTPPVIRSINQPDAPPDWWWDDPDENEDEDEEEPMTAYGLTITEPCEYPSDDEACSIPLNCDSCDGCNGDGTRTVPLDRDVTPLAQAVASYRACADLLSAAGLAMRDDDDTIAAVLAAALALFPPPLWPCSRRRTPPMSDTPTTAEEVICGVLYEDGELDYREVPEVATELVAALRSSPAALADLNGGEWVQLVDPGTPFTMWVDSESRTWWTKDDEPPRPDWTPAYRFVPQEDQ